MFCYVKAIMISLVMHFLHNGCIYPTVNLNIIFFVGSLLFSKIIYKLRKLINMAIATQNRRLLAFRKRRRPDSNREYETVPQCQRVLKNATN